MQLTRAQARAEQCRVVNTLGNRQDIRCHIFTHNIPGVTGTVSAAAYAQSLALPYGIEHQAIMLSDDLVIQAAYFTRILFQIACKKLAKASLANETDAGAVFFGIVAETFLLSQFAYNGLGKLAKRKQASLQLFAGQCVQKVGLVLLGIQPLQQANRWSVINACIVTGCDCICAKLCCVIKKCPELYFAITNNIRTRGSACLALVQKMCKYPVPVFSRETDGMQFNIEMFCNLSGIGKVFFSRAVVFIVIFVPVFHEDSVNIVALFFE